MESMRITLVQSTLFWEDIEANLEAFGAQLAPLATNTDLILLPELFTTGFSMRTDTLAEPMNGPTFQWLLAQAQQLQAAICGSFICLEQGKYYNRLVWVQADGQFFTYDKRHLFAYAGEDRHYTAGQSRLLVNYKGWTICPLICYDLRFPVWSRNTCDYDLLLYIANFPARRSFAWRQLLTARAIENLTYTIGVNRIGKDGEGIEYSGDSRVMSYDGSLLFDGKDQAFVHTISLSKEDQLAFRQRFAFLNDRDEFDFNISSTS